jgi:hypothetical protein
MSRRGGGSATLGAAQASRWCRATPQQASSVEPQAKLKQKFFEYYNIIKIRFYYS